MKVVLEFEVDLRKECDRQAAQRACLFRLVERGGQESMLYVTRVLDRRSRHELYLDGTRIGVLTGTVLR